MCGLRETGEDVPIDAARINLHHEEVVPVAERRDDARETVFMMS